MDVLRAKTGKLANFEGVKSIVPAGDLMGFNSEAMLSMQFFEGTGVVISDLNRRS
jgi:hypothetical protein